ncbi:hypothetical protein [Streptomyces chartreusis]|uniref:hypothetical protein n=1 Tax=Streptomyces chartreusis TaxID=1969 RepID=UPI0037F93C5E
MTRPFLHAAQQSEPSPMPMGPEDSTKSVVESEIVIIDDDGREEPFDPALWFS